MQAISPNTFNGAIMRRRSATCSTFTVVEEKRAESFADIIMDRIWRANHRPMDEPSKFAEVFG